MFAEAVNKSRNDLPTGISLADAFGAINTVPTRAGLKNIDSNLSYKDMFESIKHERKIELSFEGWRKYDLVRWNILGDKLRETQ